MNEFTQGMLVGLMLAIMAYFAVSNEIDVHVPHVSHVRVLI